ncbi:hypothetical protein VKT23_016738 [Stygiomarasmius scandens]|uniref:F-box domain-containing protein n=1 Tax=Marasmiellus scandens TaxID=2682957 RepID=A0ABR1ITY0_9AGAR
MLHLPSELIEVIISVTWNLPLELDERVRLMISWTLVSHFWTAAFVRAMSTYVHIPCASYCQLFLRVLEHGTVHLESPTWMNYAHYLPLLCKSMTFYIYTPFEVFLGRCLDEGILSLHTGKPITSDLHPQIDCLNETMNFLSKKSPSSGLCLPHLRCLSIHYLNQDPCDLGEERRRFSNFPITITDLEVTHTFDDRMPKCFWERSGPGAQWDQWRSGERSRQMSNPFQGTWELHGVQRLTVKGVCEEAVIYLAVRCLALKSLSTDADIVWAEHWEREGHFRNVKFRKIPQCADEKRKRLYRIRCPFDCSLEPGGIRGMIDGISRWVKRVAL